MTQDEFVANCRALASGLLGLMDAKGIVGDHCTNMITSVLIEVLAHRLGSMPAAIERLRLVADIAEADELGKLASHH